MTRLVGSANNFFQFARFAFRGFGRNALRMVSGYNLFWHAVAIAITYVSVETGLDWWYYGATRNWYVQIVLIPAALIGFFVPIIFPFILYFTGRARQNVKRMAAGAAVAQAGMLGWLVSVFYKSLTGRAHQMPFDNLTTDITGVFKFGFLRGGIGWGWPSSHTITAFAIAVAFMMMYPRNRAVKYIALIYAGYVGIAVSATIHWFSDFAAAAILGTFAGVIVGRSFSLRNREEDDSLVVLAQEPFAKSRVLHA